MNRIFPIVARALPAIIRAAALVSMVTLATEIAWAQWSTNSTHIYSSNSGNVGVGTSTPTSKLNVSGNVATTGNVTASGNISATGNISARYQDLAEWVPASEVLAAATVVVLDPDSKNTVKASRGSYDTRVAGVVSAMPGIVLGEAGDGKVKVATTGRVKVRVDATTVPIRVGDLLVSSNKKGMAMRSEPFNVGGMDFHRPGTVVGKALEPLMNGEGEILVLLSLQ